MSSKLAGKRLQVSEIRKWFKGDGVKVCLLSYVCLDDVLSRIYDNDLGYISEYINSNMKFGYDLEYE